MKLSIAILATAASASMKETEVQDAFFAGDDIVLSNPATRSNKQWHDCGEAPPVPANARAVECSGDKCAAVCPIGWRSQGRWKIKCQANNKWSHSKFSPCVTCPSMEDELDAVVEADNGVSYQEIFSNEQNLPIAQFFCGNDSKSLIIKNKLFKKGGAKRNVFCKCRNGRNGDPAWKKSCDWEFRGQPWSPSDVNDVQCKTKTKYCQLDREMGFGIKYNYQKVDGAAQFKDYFRIQATQIFENDIHLGFSDGFNGHNDDKWEIVIGGWSATKHVIRDGNQTPTEGLVSKLTTPNAYNQLKKDFIVQVTDGNISVYSSNFGSKGNLVIELNDQRIQKSKLNTLVASGGWNGYGNLRFRGVGCN